jgi:hypothetical protein
MFRVHIQMETSNSSKALAQRARKCQESIFSKGDIRGKTPIVSLQLVKTTDEWCTADCHEVLGRVLMAK